MLAICSEPGWGVGGQAGAQHQRQGGPLPLYCPKQLPRSETVTVQIRKSKQFLLHTKEDGIQTIQWHYYILVIQTVEDFSLDGKEK